MWHLPREELDLAIESLKKVRRLKNHQGWLQRRKTPKWEINIKDTILKTVYLKIICQLLNES